MGTRAIHTVFTVGGENEYRAAVKRINATIKELNSELELSKVRFEGQEGSYSALFTHQQELQRMYEAQNDLAKTYADRLKQVQDATDSLNGRSEELRDTLNQIEAALHNTSEVSTGYDELLREASEAEDELRAVETQMGKNATAALDLETGINKAHTEMEKLSRELEELEPLVREAEESTDGFAHSMDKTGEGAETMREKTVTALDAIASAAAAAQLDEVFQKILDVMRSCAEEAIEFESAMAGVFKTVDASAEEELALTKGIEDLATKLPATTTEIAAVAEAAGQLGIAKEDILAFTETMVRMGTSTNLSSEDAATSLAKLSSILGLSSEDYERMGSSIVDLGNNLAANEKEIIEIATRMAGSGDMIGLTADELFGIAAALASVGIESDAGGSAMRKLFSKIQLSMVDLREAKSQLEQMGISIEDLNRAAQEDGFEELADSAAVSVEELEAMAQALSETNKYAEVAGMAAVDFAKLWEEDAAGGLNAFIEGLAGVEKSGGDALAVLDDMGLREERLSRAITNLASSEGRLSEALDLSAAAWEENTALVEESARRYETTESKIAIMENSVGLLKKELGEDFLTAMEPVVEGLTDFAIAAADAAEESPVLATELAGIAGAVGGLAGLATVAGGIKLVSTALGIFGTAAGPVAAGVAILGGLAAAVATYHANATQLTEEAETIIAKNESLLEAVNNTKAEFINSGIASAEKQEQVQKLTDKIVALSDTVGKTDADKIIIQNYVSQLNELLPGLGLVFDDVTEKVNLSRDAILDFAEASAETAKLEAMRQYISELTEEQVDLEVQLMLTGNQIEEAEEKYAEATQALEKFTEGQTGLEKALNITNPYFLELKAAAEQAKNEVEKLKETEYNLQSSLESVEGELENTKEVFNSYQDTLKETAKTAAQAGEDAASGFAAGVISGSPKITAAGEEMGKAFASGLELGMLAQEKNVSYAADRLARGAMVQGMKDELEIHSPSRKAIEITEMYGQGLRIGLENSVKRIRDAMRDVSAVFDIKDAIAASAAEGGMILRTASAVPASYTGEGQVPGGTLPYTEREAAVYNYNVTVDAKNVKELNDIVRMVENERIDARMGVK
jgi:chromosome segregation ATPase